MSEQEEFKGMSFEVSDGLNPVTEQSPVSELNPSDPGDDVLKRFRYQITYAGILAMSIVKPAKEIVEIYCEHHEDILAKHKDGFFSGIQVKTRDINLHPFNILDDSIKKTFKRFVLLNKRFPGKFKAFSIVSNHGFDKTKPAICINNLIQNIKAGVDVLVARSKTKVFITWLASECDCTTDFVIETIKKARTYTFCALDDIKMKLINELKACGILKGVTESKIVDLADLIVARVFSASSLDVVNKDEISYNYVLGIYDEDAQTKEIIESKCIRKDDLKNWLENEKIQPVKLLLKDRMKIASAPEGYRKLELKMDAGGVDSENIELVRDFKFAFEQHTTAWLYKEDIEQAEGKYNQILRITHNLCKEVYDEESISSSDDKGNDMLIKVRKLLKARKSEDSSLFFDCTYEHLIGSVGVLTENCKVWWSRKFEIPE